MDTLEAWGFTILLGVGYVGFAYVSGFYFSLMTGTLVVGTAMALSLALHHYRFLKK